MRLQNKTIIVTGGANGIGLALCKRFAREGARGVVVADVDGERARREADAIGALGIGCDVASEADVRRLVAETEAAFGPVDLFCSNAGISVSGGVEVSDAEWQRIWNIHLMGHVYAARAVLPGMISRGGGYLLHTASAAGLLSQIGSAPYSVTKHATVALAEWLSITYGDRGIKVSCLCPQGVRTNMLGDEPNPISDFLRETALDPAAVADVVVAGIDEERFLILPHAIVGEYFQRRASDHDRWLRGMRRLQAQMGSRG